MNDDPPEGSVAEAKAAAGDAMAWLKRQDPVKLALGGFAALVVLVAAFSPPAPPVAVKRESQVKAEKAADAKQAASEAAADAAAIAARLSDDQIRECDQNLAKLAQIGLIRDRPARNRIDVDEKIWAEMPYKQKDALLGLVSCSAFGRYVPEGNDRTVAYGWRDGELKLIWSAAGSF